MLSARTAEGIPARGYARHRPEQTLLYQIVEQHYPDFLSAMEAQDRPLPGYVQDEFEAILALRPGFVLDEARPSLVNALARAKKAIAGVRAFSTVVVSIPSGAEISLDGKPVGIVGGANVTDNHCTFNLRCDLSQRLFKGGRLAGTRISEQHDPPVGRHRFQRLRPALPIVSFS